MAAYELPEKLTPFERVLFAVPVLGRISKEVAYGAKENLYYALATFLMGWATLVLLFGLPGLYLPAVALVPVIFALLVLISRG
ncbi:hypothetical protein GG681_10875 [Epibacterium sp. SM1969]|uniref:Uncharacterized protein n=1 Tax=Tritonibacter aquimaris TaxID=2663379 RepID=A0A844AM21_9RHOB|nr:hypothetical protein [Tritonibacter aquimaris]MQY43145.1 hypothetical protein [Tritonibacter aquimaris]